MEKRVHSERRFYVRHGSHPSDPLTAVVQRMALLAVFGAGSGTVRREADDVSGLRTPSDRYSSTDTATRTNPARVKWMTLTVNGPSKDDDK